MADEPTSVTTPGSPAAVDFARDNTDPLFVPFAMSAHTRSNPFVQPVVAGATRQQPERRA